jgi:hypothetical protein
MGLVIATAIRLPAGPPVSVTHKFGDKGNFGETRKEVRRFPQEF